MAVEQEMRTLRSTGERLMQGCYRTKATCS